MEHAAEFDLIAAEHLRGVGGLKWSAFPDTIGAFVAEMDFGTAPAVTEALHGAVDLGLVGYLPPGIAGAMSRATAEWHRTVYGWDLAPEQVHPVADVLKALEVVITSYSRPGSPVILPTPAYMPFLTVPPALGRDVIQVPLRRDEDGTYGLDIDGIDAAYRAGGHLLILCNPYNPVGRVFSRTELMAVADVVAAHGGRVFSDEIHAPLVFPGARHLPYASLSEVTAAHTVTATSASKAWNLPGLKCAQVILSNEADALVWEQIGWLASHGASTLGVVANTAAFTAGQEWLEQVVRYLDGNRRALTDLLAEHLPQVGYTPPQGTYIAWLDCRGLGIDGSPADFFRQHAGVSLTDGTGCGDAGEGFVRLIFATPRPILEQAVASMGDAVRKVQVRLAG
jgi:cystathionine beta-lyase